jgi:hypothetical protein
MIAALSAYFTMASVGEQNSALARARQLASELPERRNATTSGGETEGHEWWTEHAELFEQARQELGPLHPSIYDIEANADQFIDSDLLDAVQQLEKAAAAGLKPVEESALWALLRPASAPGVWRLRLLTDRFCELLLEELRHYEASGIPLRRPNGMNRYGCILDSLGFQRSLDFLCRRYVRPLAQMMYPWLIGDGDADEHYGFVVRYKLGEDLSLAEHADAAVVTCNVNLADPSGFRGGRIAFRGTRFVDERPKEVPQSIVDFGDFTAGEAIIHLGGQYHSALPLEGGERSNLVVWLTAEHGVVRIMPYGEEDEGRLGAQQRWSAFATERVRARLVGAGASVTRFADVPGADERDEL